MALGRTMFAWKRLLDEQFAASARADVG